MANGPTCRLLAMLPRVAAIAPVVAPVVALACGHDPAAAREGVASGAATATIIRPLTVIRLSDLDFGLLQARSGGEGEATVTIDPASARTHYSNGAAPACLADLCVSPYPAAFTVEGEPGRSYRVQAPQAIDAPVGTMVLKVDSFTTSTSSRPEGASTGVLDPSAQDSFRIGATLRVPAAMPVTRVIVVVPVSVSYE